MTDDKEIKDQDGRYKLMFNHEIPVLGKAESPIVILFQEGSIAFIKVGREAFIELTAKLLDADILILADIQKILDRTIEKENERIDYLQNVVTKSQNKINSIKAFLQKLIAK